MKIGDSIRTMTEKTIPPNAASDTVGSGKRVRKMLTRGNSKITKTHPAASGHQVVKMRLVDSQYALVNVHLPDQLRSGGSRR